MRTPEELRTEWTRLRAEGGRHALDIAEALGVAEVELLASACGVLGETSTVRLDADWAAFLAKMPRLGRVKTVTRNPHAVIEVEGTYDNVEFFGAMGQSVSSIDLRIFVQRWRHGFAVREETRRGVSRGLQFFDAHGRAIHKVYLRDASEHAVYDDLVREHTAKDQSRAQQVEPLPPPAPDRPDAEVDAAGLRAAWEAMQDTHEFFGILRKFGVARTQALRLAGTDLARPVDGKALETLLTRVAGTDLPIMVFVGNPGVIQIHSGPIKRVAPMGPWFNVLDPGFDLHVRMDRVASAWVVRKPTADGPVTSLEVYDAAGEQIALLVGKRKPGQKESDGWRSAVEALA